MNTEERLWPRFDYRADGCWQWLGRTTPKGYGMIAVGCRQKAYIHRVSYELLRELIPDGLQIDHLCRNRGCGNPFHLEPVTARENLHRGQTSVALNAAKTMCSRGHSYDAANTYTDKLGKRHCRVCHAGRERAAYHNRLGEQATKRTDKVQMVFSETS